MVNVRVVATFELPGLAEYLARVLRHDQHGGHAKRMRHRKIASEVLEHGGAFGIDAVRLEEALIGLRRRLRLKLGRDDVEHVIEVPFELKPCEHLFGMVPGAVGEDQLSSFKILDRGAKGRVWLERRVIDLVHEVEE